MWILLVLLVAPFALLHAWTFETAHRVAGRTGVWRQGVWIAFVCAILAMFWLPPREYGWGAWVGGVSYLLAGEGLGLLMFLERGI